jgi:tryptophan synthase alpha chain
MTLPRGAARIRAAFDAARADDRAALVAYLMAGHPDDAASLAAAEAALEAGADLLAVGVPFSDPVADGPVIAAAGHATLAAGGGLESALRLVRALREAGHAQPLPCRLAGISSLFTLVMPG